MRLLVVYLHHHFSAKFIITLNLRVIGYSSDQLCSGILLLPPPGQPGPHRPSTSSTEWRPGWKGANLNFKCNGTQQKTHTAAISISSYNQSSSSSTAQTSKQQQSPPIKLSDSRLSHPQHHDIDASSPGRRRFCKGIFLDFKFLRAVLGNYSKRV